MNKRKTGMKKGRNKGGKEGRREEKRKDIKMKECQLEEKKGKM